MTKQQAIEVLQDMLLDYSYASHKEEVYEAVGMAIEALTQSAQLETCPLYGGVCGYPSEKCYECPRHSRISQPEQKWIPVTERLPEISKKPFYIDPIDEAKLFESDSVLVYGVNEDGYAYSVASRIYSTESGDEWAGAYDAADIELKTILAWMPLPEPYREEGE